MTRHPDFPQIQQRLARLGLYDFTIDDIWGNGMSSGIDQALTLLERAHADLKPFDAATGGQDLLDPALPKIPKEYAWLRTVGYLPRHLRVALNLYGTLEAAGSRDNPQIMAWAKACREAGIDVKGYTADSVPWCGLFMAYVMLEADRVAEAKAIGGTLWALNWSKFGEAGGQPELGDILTFTRNGGGHVGFYIGEDSAYYFVLGGNQSDRVNIMRLKKGRMHACRQVPYNVKPASATVRILTGSGAPVSRNEA